MLQPQLCYTVGGKMSNHFWFWFLRKICSSQRITLPNVGTFSVVFSEKKTINMIWKSSILAANQDDGQWSETIPDLRETTIPRRAYIRFRPTGHLKTSIKEFLHKRGAQGKRCYTGDHNPVVSVVRWGKYVSKDKDISNLSQHRKLIWWYHLDHSVSLLEAARVVSNNLQDMGNKIANHGFARLGDGMRIQIVRGRKNIWNKEENLNRWRTRFSVPQGYIIQAISDLNIQ